LKVALKRRRTIEASNNPSVVHAAVVRNNGRYNGNGREWETPPEIFLPLHKEFDFTVDVAASRKNAKLSRYYTEKKNGLRQDWGGERVWLQPPYGREIYAWTRKAVSEHRRAEKIVALLPASTDLAWWHEDVLPFASEIRCIRGRVRFLTGGPYRASGFFASAVVIWSPTKPRKGPLCLPFVAGSFEE
jgi:phage N-6-adenine-methyltransferase